VAGEQQKGASLQDSSVTLYWKNGSEAPLQNPSNSGGYTNSVFINSNYSQVREENSTATYPRSTQSTKPGIVSLVEIFSSSSKKSNSTAKQTTTHKNNSSFLKKVKSSNLFSNQGKHQTTAKSKRK
jgi:hypothetical protein